MKILVVRHAPAGDRIAYRKSGKPDAERPLTPAGRRKFRKAARGLARAVPELGLVVSSPLVRARQTAGILSKVYPKAALKEFDELSPGAAYSSLARKLAVLSKRKTAALVGHEPHLSGFVGWLAGGRKLRLELKKGSACLLACDGAPRPGKGRLLWSLSPRLLRKLG
ncbi:MAG: histidine phosphatase family protein [Elusimicrobia bacterium]|nr:histidine phosphatase family protein [Elusimicrobiota bacterium]